jgi:transposase
MQKKRRPRYNNEFKKRAVDLSKEKGIEFVANELDISPSSVIRWRAKFGKSPVRSGIDQLSAREMKNLLEEQQRRIDQLEKEKKIAEMERDILKKATAFFARESE